MNEDAPRQPTTEQLLSAGRLIGLDFTEAECEAMAARVGARAGHFAELRAGPLARLANHDIPPLYFNPQLPGSATPATVERNYNIDDAPLPERPVDLESLAFWPISQLARLLRSRQLSSLELTEMYLARLQRFGPQLECVVTLDGGTGAGAGAARRRGIRPRHLARPAAWHPLGRQGLCWRRRAIPRPGARHPGASSCWM